MSFVSEVDILDEAKECFLVYAEEVLTDRAIPAAEDGLLSSQRKILWTMENVLKMNSKGKTKKSNAVVGSTLATSYYHGDASCYGVLCKMSQKYLMRYPLIDGQGALGTQEDNDLVASSRYTEAKPSIYADLMMTDYNKNPVPTKETYNGEYMEPVVLPGLFPNALCNGRQSIGVSMAHCSPSHNLTEVCNAILAYIKDNNIDVTDYILGPDFPLGGTIINKSEIKSALRTGKSSVSLKVRGDYEIDGNRIIFTSIPYRTYRNKIKAQLEKNVDAFEKVMEDFNDESSIGQNRLVFEAKTGRVDELLDMLFGLTDLQATVSYNMNFIVNGTPKLCSIKDLIVSYVNHQNQIIINIAKVDLAKAEKKKHILEGMLIALKDIDKAIELIKNSLNRAEAKEALISYFKITEEQADAILDMKLAKLTKLDKDELLKEIEELTLAIVDYTKRIENESYRMNVLSEKVEWLKKNYGDDRRTKLTQITIAPKSKEEKKLEKVEPEKCVVVMTESGYIKRVPTAAYKIQKRNSVGIKSQDDITSAVIRTNTVDSLMIFTNHGKLHRLIVNDIPVGTNASKGTPVRALVEMASGETATAIYSIYRDNDIKYIYFVTKKGSIKKVLLSDYATAGKKKGGIAALKIREDDSLASTFLANDEDIIIISRDGKAIRLKSDAITASTRTSLGIKGMNTEEVAVALPLRKSDEQLAVFTSSGLGKRTALSEFGSQSRGGKGIVCVGKDETIASAAIVNENDYILIAGDKTSLCISAKELPVVSRPASGVAAIKNNKILTVTKVWKGE